MSLTVQISDAPFEPLSKYVLFPQAAVQLLCPIFVFFCVVKKIRNIGDNCIQVEPLPKSVLTAFDAHIHGNVAERRIPVADLSRVCDNVVSTLMPFQREGVK